MSPGALTGRMAPVRRIVLDVLKPHEPELVGFTERLADLDGVDAVDASLIELDREVQNVRLAVEGESLDYEAIRDAVRDLGGTVHSVDGVACGEYVLREPTGPSSSGAAWLR